MSVASPWPSIAGGGPKSSRCTPRRQRAGSAQDPVLDASAGGAGGRQTTTEAGYAISVENDRSHTARHRRVYGGRQRRDGGSDDNGSADRHAGRRRARPSARPADAAGGADRDLVAAGAVDAVRSAGPATATCSRSRSPTKGTWVMLSDPDAVKQVFTGDPRVFHAGEGNQILAPVLGDNSILVLDEKPHMSQRRCCCRPSTASACRPTARRWPRSPPREIEQLAQRHPVRAAAADAGDHPGDHPAHRLRRPRGGERMARAARRAARVPRPHHQPRCSCPCSSSAPSGSGASGAFRRRIERVDELIYREIAERRARRRPRASATTSSRCWSPPATRTAAR